MEHESTLEYLNEQIYEILAHNREDNTILSVNKMLSIKQWKKIPQIQRYPIMYKGRQNTKYTGEEN